MMHPIIGESAVTQEIYFIAKQAMWIHWYEIVKKSAEGGHFFAFYALALRGAATRAFLGGMEDPKRVIAVTMPTI